MLQDSFDASTIFCASAPPFDSSDSVPAPRAPLRLHIHHNHCLHTSPYENLFSIKFTTFCHINCISLFSNILILSNSIRNIKRGQEGSKGMRVLKKQIWEISGKLGTYLTFLEIVHGQEPSSPWNLKWIHAFLTFLSPCENLFFSIKIHFRLSHKLHIIILKYTST